MRLAAAFAVASFLALPLRAQDPAAQPLQVRKIVVYKHGVGYFEREGKVRDNQQIGLSFKTAQMKDLLKSLYAVDLSGGRISTITYDTKDPLSKQLEDILIRVPDGNALTAFLTQLKGARVEVLGGGQSMTGSIIGIEPIQKQTPTGTITSYKLILFRDDGSFAPVELLELSSLKLLDESLQKDLKRVLDIYLKAKHADRKTVLLNATGQGDRNVRVGYIIETPIWKTSYRLLFDGENKPLLQGWAILENTTDEDWNQIDVSFVAGSPMSFIMDLYTAYYPQREEIPVGVTAAPKPQGRMEAGAGGDNKAGERRRSLAKEMNDAEEEKAFAPQAPAAAPALRFAEALELANLPAAVGVDIGDLFSYQATEKVSIKRGQAALVPILSERVEGAERVLYYRPTLSPRPMNTCYFKNTTSLTLESGPVTFFDGSTCVGEGLLRRVLKKDMKEMLPYAIEAGVSVETKIDHRSDPVTRGFIANGLLVLTYTENQETLYTIKNQLTHDAVFYLDHARAGGYALTEPAKAEEEVEGHYRFKLDLKTGATAEFKVRESMQTATQVALLGTPAETIRFYLDQRYLSDPTKKFLREVVALQTEINQLRQGENDLAQERQQLNEDQERARRNLATFRDTPKEAELRDKYLKRLEEAEKRIEQIRVESKEKTAKRQSLESDLARKVQEFKEE